MIIDQMREELGKNTTRQTLKLVSCIKREENVCVKGPRQISVCLEGSFRGQSIIRDCLFELNIC